MDDEARALKRRELEEKRKKLEKMRAQRATRSKTAEDSIKVKGLPTVGLLNSAFIIYIPRTVVSE